MTTIYKALSEDRKRLQEQGQLPEWLTTGGYQLFVEKYKHEAVGLRDTYGRIAKTLSRHMGTDSPEWEAKFFNLLWKGHMAASTPVLSNTGTNKGMPVSCSGQAISDTISSFYRNQEESAVLTKHGFGTSAYLGFIRPRGASISRGGKASGTLPVFKDFVQVMRDVAQGTSRRGAWAGYYPVDGDDFLEIVDYLKHNPDDLNVGWIITDNLIELMEAGDEDAWMKFRKALVTKCITGKGYFLFTDKVNRQSPLAYKIHDLEVLASNLCTEIFLHSSRDETFTCVLSSMNVSKFDEWKDTDAVFDAIVFLECVTQEFLDLVGELEDPDEREAFQKAVNGTERGRPLGLGALGYHTYIQSKGWSLDDPEAIVFNRELFAYIKSEAHRANVWLAERFGETEYTRGLGIRHTHLLAVAPNTSSALICGGVSQGIEPVAANVYNQPTAAGEIYRVNPVFLELAKKRVGWTKELAQDIIDNQGSVQHLDWLSSQEKRVFRTHAEYNQKVLIDLACHRQEFICQGQSLNLAYQADTPEETIADDHWYAFKKENCLALYYMRNQAGVQAAKDECKTCEA